MEMLMITHKCSEKVNLYAIIPRLIVYYYYIAGLDGHLSLWDLWRVISLCI